MVSSTVLFRTGSVSKCTGSISRYGTHRTISGLHQEQLIHANTTTHMHPQHDNTYISRKESLLERNGDLTASECDDNDDDYNEDLAINTSNRGRKCQVEKDRNV